jgi:hypothetical protein
MPAKSSRSGSSRGRVSVRRKPNVCRLRPRRSLIGRIRSSKGARCDASFPLISLVRGDGRGQVLLGEGDRAAQCRSGPIQTTASSPLRSSAARQSNGKSDRRGPGAPLSRLGERESAPQTSEQLDADEPLGRRRRRSCAAHSACILVWEPGVPATPGRPGPWRGKARATLVGATKAGARKPQPTSEV